MIPRYLADFSLDAMETHQTEVIVIGSGIAGLFTAINVAEQYNVTLISKRTLLDSNTRYAQGGIAAVFSEDDSPLYHLEDTLTAGAGLCDRKAVDILVHEGPKGVENLIAMGTNFDIENGTYALTQEGAHSKRRILHAGGDSTGAEIVRALSALVRKHPKIQVWDEHFVIDLITQDNECLGALVQKPNGKKLYVAAAATILCTGGAGQLYRYTTNPEVATADGIAIAYRAGARIRDVEFIQFHPTALYYPGAPRFLISEAVRGEGAFLRNNKGERFMEKYHSQLELAPRDIVARAIVDEMQETKSTFVHLDFSHESPSKIKQRFPTIYAFCLSNGLDLTTDWIPVAPAAHYMMGGVQTDLNGETSVHRLFACGEVSSTGIHGANRLASNSLSEAIVFGRRIVDKVSSLSPVTHIPNIASTQDRTESSRQAFIERRLKLQKLMLRYAGLKRSAEGLQKGLEALQKQVPIFHSVLNQREQYEFANMLTSALLIVQAAMRRQESRGGHYREDFRERDDHRWLKHIIQHRTEGMTEERIDEV